MNCPNDINTCNCSFCSEARFGRLLRSWYSQDVFTYPGEAGLPAPAQAAKPADPKVDSQVFTDDDLPF